MPVEGGSQGPFAPSPATELTTLRLLTAAVGTYPWCAGHAFRAGDLPGGAQLDGVQLSVKSRWPDGSAKIAILAGVTACAGTSEAVRLGLGVQPTGTLLSAASLRAAGVTASIETDKYGTASWSGADWESPFVHWVSGPVMSSWIYRKPVGSDEHLTAWLEVRLWATGDLEVLPWIENGYLLKAAPGGRPGVYRFVLDGRERFNMTVPVHHHTRQPLISGQALSHWLGADRTVTPKHNATYLATTGLVTPMLAAVQRNLPAFPSWGGVSASFTPYEPFTPTTTIHSTNMGSAGGSDSIGIQPGWESIALVDNSKLGYEQMLRESFRFGAHQIHYRDESTQRPIRFSTRNGVQLRYGDPLLNVANAEDYGLTSTPVLAGGKGDDTNKWARSHQPGSPVLAYVMSGRFWFMEECQHIAAVNFLSTPWTRKGTPYHRCEPVRTPARMQMREAAWCFRNLVNASTVTPDDDPLKQEFDASVDHNIDYYHGRYIAPFGSNGLNPLGLIEHVGNGTTGGDQAWQYDFWTMSWARAIAHRVGSTTAKRKNASAFFEWVSRSIVGRCGTTAASDYLYRSLSTSHAVGNAEYSSLFPGSNPNAYPDWNGGSGPWWESWGAYYEYNARAQGYTGAKVDGPIYGGYSSDANAWTMHAINALRASASLQAPGAAAAMARLEASQDWWWWVSRSNPSGIWGGDTRPTNAHATLTLPLEL
ncbi:MAG: hypothetical protein J0L57_01530 [Burkholderiales bacterium]|nr:hypothetical protein [Burkholderiales bacterium]